MIEILSSSALSTVQDLGRSGALRWGVGTSGAMDPMALAAGNLLLGNDEGDAAIEVQVFPYEVRFGNDCAFALTGAETGATLDGRMVLPWWRTTARAGQVLRLNPPRRGVWAASRAYLCVAGGVAVEPVLGSRSTQLRGAFGGHEGRTLRQGDRIAIGLESVRPDPSIPQDRVRPAGESKGGREQAQRASIRPQGQHGPSIPQGERMVVQKCRLGGDDDAGFGLIPPALAMPLHVDGMPAVRVLPAAEYDAYTEASRASFWARPWKITPQSDRYGYRLAGEPLEPIAPMETRSHGIVPGVIQVPSGGQPIVQMRDAQPSGGYPKIGTVIEADLWRLGQAPIGSQIRFVQTTWQEAVDALEENRRWLADCRRKVELWRTRAGATA